MRILLDASVPAAVSRFLPLHETTHASEGNWGSLSDDELMCGAEQAGFDAVITADRNMSHSILYNCTRIALIVLTKFQWGLIQDNGGVIEKAVSRVSPRSYVIVAVGGVRAPPATRLRLTP